MAYIRIIDEDEADGELFQAYDEIQRTRGRVSNVLRIMSLDPKVLKAHLGLYLGVVFGKGGLSRREREFIAVVVSATNGCTYCVTHHSEALNKYAKDMTWVKSVAADHKKAKLNAREKALSEFAVGLTRSPAEGRKEAVDALRGSGFTDEEIHQAAQVVAYFNYINRVVSGLGVDLESDDERDYNY